MEKERKKVEGADHMQDKISLNQKIRKIGS